MHNQFAVLAVGEDEEMENHSRSPPECTILKLLFLGDYLADKDNRNKSKIEIPINEVDKNAIIMAHDILLRSKGTKSLKELLDTGCDHAIKYADAENSPFLTLKKKQTFSYADIRKKVDAFSKNDHFCQARSRPAGKDAGKEDSLVTTTFKKLNLVDFLKEKPELFEEGKGALLTHRGLNIIRGILERIIIRFEIGKSGGLKPHKIFILDKAEGFIDIDHSAGQQGGNNTLVDDLSGFGEVILLIRAKYPNVPVLLDGFYQELTVTTRFREVKLLRSHPLLSTITERIYLLHEAKLRLMERSYYRSVLHDSCPSTLQEDFQLKTIKTLIKQHPTLSKCSNNDEGEAELGPSKKAILTGHCVSLLRNKVFHMNDDKAPIDRISESKLDAAVRDVFPEVYSLIFRVNNIWKTHPQKEQSLF